MSNIKEKFIQELINELNRENEGRIYYDKKPLDICYMVSVIEQKIEECEEFMQELSNKKWVINGYDEDYINGYTNGEIRILIEKPEEEKESEYLVDAFEDYCYYIEFLFDERMWGYCQCTPEDEGYNEKYKCCGVGCDWVAPAIRITKEVDLGYYKWEGYERDYWEYEKQFYKKEENKSKKVEEYKKQQRIKEIQRQIKQLQEELEKLQ
jgi:hypothetical protein